MTGSPASQSAFSISVTPLENVPEARGLLENWFTAEWPDWYGPEGPGNAQGDLVDCLGPGNCLPRCLVALNSKSQPVGTVSLRNKSPGSERFPGVWLTALLVPAALRHAGIGARLVAAAEGEAERLGYPEVFAATATAQSLLRRRNWACHDVVTSPSGDLEIFRKPLEVS